MKILPWPDHFQKFHIIKLDLRCTVSLGLSKSTNKNYDFFIRMKGSYGLKRVGDSRWGAFLDFFDTGMT